MGSGFMNKMLNVLGIEQSDEYDEEKILLKKIEKLAVDYGVRRIKLQ